MYVNMFIFAKTTCKVMSIIYIYIYIYISHPAITTQSAQITISPNNRKAMELSLSKIKWCALYMSNLLKNVIVRLLHPRSKGSHGLETFLATSAEKLTTIPQL